MRISDLQKLLARVKRKHGNIEILECRFSDYGPMDKEPFGSERSVWEVVQAAPQQDGNYIMRDHYSLTEGQRKAMDFRPYLLYKGN